MSTTLIVMQERQVVARVENYDGPVPRKGDYIFHPPLDDDGTTEEIQQSGKIAGCVSEVCLGIYARPQHGESYFTGRSVNIIEVTL